MHIFQFHPDIMKKYVSFSRRNPTRLHSIAPGGSGGGGWLGILVVCYIMTIKSDQINHIIINTPTAAKRPAICQ